jgi:hypothetical protein
MADDSAKIEISAASSQLDAGLRDAASKVNRWALGISSTTAGMLKTVGKPLATIGTGALHRAGAGATDFVADQAKATKGFEGDLVRLGIAGDLNRLQLDKMREAALKHSTQLGIGKEQIVKGTQAYVDLTGDVAGATQSMEDFARISAATGATMDDVSTSAAALRVAGIQLKDMPNVYSGLIAQGKQGAVSLKDFAGQLAELLPKWGQLKGGNTAKGVNELGAALQIARTGFGSASEASTGLQRMVSNLVQNAKHLREAGVNVFDFDKKTGVKSLKSFEEIMKAIEKSKIVKDPELLKKVFESSEGLQAFNMLMKGRQALDGQESSWRKLIAAGGDYKMLAKDLGTWLDSAPGKADQAWEKLKNKIAEAFTPDRLESFAELLEKAVEKAGDLVDKLAEIKDYVSGDKAKDLNPFAVHAKDVESTKLNDFLFAGGLTGFDTLSRHFTAVTADELGKDPNSAMGKNRAAWDTERAKIDAAKTRTDKIRAAVDAAFLMNADEAKLPGRIGRQRAGADWLEKQGISQKTIDAELALRTEEHQKRLEDALKQTGLAIVSAIQHKQFSFSVDGNKVDDELSKSTNSRYRPR